MMGESGCERMVMVVEDDCDVRDSLLEVLEDHAYAPLAASNGKEALDRLRARGQKPCVILLDVMMPVMDGWGFRAAQAQDSELSGIPVVVLTAHASAAETAREMHAAGFLKKPITLDALLATIERHCEPSLDGG
jgi:CheY-like chemotaxis protein